MKAGNDMEKKRARKRASQPVTLPVRLSFVHPTAKLVCIAGTFNDWHPSVTEMIPLGDGRWIKEFTVPPGIYEYRFVVDGQWMADPNAPETVLNPYGGMNSVLRV